MLHKVGKPKDLAGSYRPLSLTSCPGQLMEKGLEKEKGFEKGFRKNGSTNDNLFKLFETIKLGFCKGHSTTGIFFDVEKAFDKVWYHGHLFKLISMGLNRKLIRWIIRFLYQRNLIISIKDELSDPITPIQGNPLSPVLFSLYFSDISQPLDTEMTLEFEHRLKVFGVST